MDQVLQGLHSQIAGLLCQHKADGVHKVGLSYRHKSSTTAVTKVALHASDYGTHIEKNIVHCQRKNTLIIHQLLYIVDCLWNCPRNGTLSTFITALSPGIRFQTRPH